MKELQLDVWQVQRMHLRKRFRQRFKIKITESEIDEIILGIQLGRSELIEKKLSHRSVHAVAVRGEVQCVAYDDIQRMIVTVLPTWDGRVKSARINAGRTLRKWVAQSIRHLPKP